MAGTEVAEEKGIGGEVSGELRVWKCVEKLETTLKRPGRAAKR